MTAPEYPQWIRDRMPTEKPLWHSLLDRPAPKAPEDGAVPGVGKVLALPGSGMPYALAACAAELDDLARTPEGNRNDRLNIAAFNLAQLVAAGYLPRAETINALFRVGVGTGLEEGEVRGTIRSAFEAGERSPRKVAPSHGEEPPPVSEFVPRIGPGSGAGSGSGGGQQGGPETGEDDEEGGPDIGALFPAVDWHALWEADDEEEWIVEPLIPARRLVALFSPPKIGKSLLMLDLAVAISQGLETLGYTPTRPRRVLYVDFENDPRGDVRPRLQAMGKKPGDLDNLFLLSFPRLPYLDTAMGGIQLLGVVEHYQCEVVVIDTISRAVGGEENANDTWLAFYRNTGLALKAAEVACIRLDHTGKDPTRGMRGGSAKYGDVDVVWEMRPDPVSENTITLECVANRLPIAERSLRVERQEDPLRHVVTTKRLGAALREQELALIDHLDRLGVARDAGRDKCKDALKAAGVSYNSERLAVAIRLRKDAGYGAPVAPVTTLFEVPREGPDEGPDDDDLTQPPGVRNNGQND